MITKEDTQALKQQLSARMPELARAFGYEKSRRDGNSLRFGTNGSLSVVFSGPEAGKWYDHEAGKGGGPIDFIIYNIGGDFKSARQWGMHFVGGIVSQFLSRQRPTTQTKRNVRRDGALNIWRSSLPIAATIGEKYLRGRGINFMPPKSVARFNPEVYWRIPIREGTLSKKGISPALIVAVHDIDTGKFIAVQRRYLDGAGNKHPFFLKAKSYGSTKNGAAMITGQKIKGAGLNIVEGFENALAAVCLGYRDVWSVQGTSGIRSFPILDDVQKLRVLADNDEPNSKGRRAGHDAALYCANRWSQAGRIASVTIPPHGDVNDHLIELNRLKREG